MALALLLTASASSEAGPVSERLFCVERSKNANVVCYDVRLRRGHVIDTGRPLDAYWIMHAEDGRREELSALERAAYGFTLSAGATQDGFRFRMRAVPRRAIRVRHTEAGFRAEVRISNRNARLGGLFVQTRETLGLPTILYVLVRGVDLETGNRLEERLANR